MMATAEPAYLPLGTEVSAKYRGAFCEATVKSIVKSVKVKVTLKEGLQTLLTTDDNITGSLKVGAVVEVKHPDTGKMMEAVVNKTTDCSMYTVVFDDADERTLRRTQLCLKGEKHFIESETLDNLPLSNPEHFGTPVISSKGKRNRSSHGTGRGEEESEEESSEEEGTKRAVYKGRNQDLVGKVMMYEPTDRRKAQQVPVLVVLPDAHQTELKTKDHLLVRSFKDGKFLGVPKKDLSVITREAAMKNDDRNIKVAIEKALLYLDNKELPPSWNFTELLGSEDEEESEDDESSDDEQSEEKDRFVAQLYKFCDDRGTPINKGPTIGNKDLNLYRLFKIVQNIGGYNRVTNQMKWRLVYSKMLLPPSNTASTQIKNAYKKYLHAFEDFYRKLGSTMGTISRPGRSRNNSGRSILPFRGRDSPRAEKDDSKGSESEKETAKEPETNTDKNEVESESTKVEASPPKRPKSARIRLEMKDDKKDEIKEKKETKKEEKKETKKDEEPVKKTGKKEKEEKKEKEDKKDKEEKEEKKEPELIKKPQKKTKETDSPARASKKEQEDKETPDLKKNVGRRRSLRNEDGKKDGAEEEETDSKPEKKEKKKEEKKEVEKEEKKEKKKGGDKEEVEKKKEEAQEVVAAVKEKKKESAKKGKAEEAKPAEAKVKKEDSTSSVDFKDIPMGTKLRVRYGKGRNQKEYEAKVVEKGFDSGHVQYLVHYAGWNMRYDEWIRPERIVRIVEKLGGKKRNPKPSPSPKPPLKVGKKSADKPPASPSNSSSRSSSVEATRPSKSKSPASSVGSASTVASKARPTRSNSIEVVEGLLPMRRSRKTSGMYDSVKDSESEVSCQSDEEKEEEKEEDKKDVGKNTMPAIATDKGPEEEDMEIDESVDRSPPRLSKVTDLIKEKVDAEETQDKKDDKTTKPESKDKPAPVLKVIEPEKVDEPILQKFETILVETTGPKVSKTEVKETMKKKEADKKKDVEKKGGKKDKDKEKEPQFKWEGGDSSPRKSDKSKEIVVAVEDGKQGGEGEENPYEFKDEDEFETDFKPRDRRKPVVVVDDVRKEVVEEVKVKEETIVESSKTEEVVQETVVMAVTVSGLEEKDDVKSDSEVEKTGKPKGKKREAKKPKAAAVDKKTTSVASPERKPVTVPLAVEKRTGPVTLAEKKAFFTPIDRNIEILSAAVDNKELEEDKKALPAEDQEGGTTKPQEKSEQIVTQSEVTVPAPGCRSPRTEAFLAGLRDTGSDGSSTVLERNDQRNSLPATKEGTETEKKKVKKKTKKKAEMLSDGSNESAKKDSKSVKTKEKVGAKVKDNIRKREYESSFSETGDYKEADSEESKELDIDLRCEERIKSGSASPEPGAAAAAEKLVYPQSQGFEPLLEAVESQLKDRQNSDQLLLSRRENKDSLKNDLFENTPPTTPEHENDTGDSSHSDKLTEKLKHSSVNGKSHSQESGSSKLDTSQGTGGESPNGNASPSSNRSSASSGMVGGSEGSIDVPVHAPKRRRESDESTPSKRRKRAIRGKATSEKLKMRHIESDSEDASNLSGKCASPQYPAESSYPSRSSLNTSSTASAARINKSPRPSKYNFNLEEGKYLEGETRIAFLVDKIQEIRKIYMNLKSEVACIDRRRKRARRKDKSSASSSTVEVDCS